MDRTSMIASYAKKLSTLPVDVYNLLRWKLGFCRRLRQHPPIFVFQMGKVASKAIQGSLGSVYPGVVIHGHQFSATHKQGEVRELYQYLHGDRPPTKLYVISPIRDPISRNISALFENYKLHAGVAPEVCTRTNEEILALFMEKFPHEQPLVFFDANIKRHFGIDVYSEPFPDCGYAQYERNGVHLLVLRVELPDEVKNRVVGEFVGIKGFAVSGSNIAARKAYAPLYRRFTSQCILPREYVDRMCESTYFRHFYSPTQIEQTRNRWLNPRA